MREAYEETHLQLKDLNYNGSFPIDDWRYRGERDKVTTVLFTALINDGKPQPDDDIHELKWFDFTEDLLDEVVPNHVVLVDALLSEAFADYESKF
jgi:bifunctional NMN adenylyltransferase/nudix hydrolase